MKLPGLDRLGSVGLVGERKALSLLCLGFYTTLFFMITLSSRSELPEWLPVFAAMTTIYAVAFFGVAAEWFWGRWFATGLGYWGCTMAVMAFVTTRSLPAPMVIFGIMHAIIAVTLMGEKMAAAFDAKPEWREKWKLDEQGVLRVRRSVTRMASSLPALVMFALAPREGAERFGLSSVTFDATTWTLFVLGVVAFGGILWTRRTWAVLALTGVGVATLAKSLMASGELYTAPSYFDPASLPQASTMFHLLGVFAGVAVVAATLPFLGPVARFLSKSASSSP